MPKSYYAFEWWYGVATTNAGVPIGTLHKFGSPAQRDKWCAEGKGEYRSSPGYREPVSYKWRGYSQEPVEH